MPREENRREMEYEAPTSSQRDSEVSNSYTGPESNPQDNKVCTTFNFNLYYYLKDILVNYIFKVIMLTLV